MFDLVKDSVLVHSTALWQLATSKSSEMLELAPRNSCGFSSLERWL